MLMAEADVYRRFRAPIEDGQTLVAPARAELANVIDRNRHHLAASEYDVQGRSLGELAASARRSLVNRALAYTQRYRTVSPRHLEAAGRGGPIVLSGHQPQLFHAGVWYKNFVLGSVAAEVGGAAIHLLIDSDLCRSASIRVPSGSVVAPRAETVAFDELAADVPYEERIVRDESRFAGFSAEVRQHLRPFLTAPLVEELWPLMPTASEERNLGLRIARGRHRLEEILGNDTLELPQSGVCQLPEFHWFVAHLAAHMPRFQLAYNESLAAYRQAHHLRNRAHPIPDLVESDGWLEAPFWMWTADDPHRSAVFVRQRGDTIELSDRRQQTIVLPLTAESDAALAADELAAAAGRGIKLRTRALGTTLFARLALSDLFLHGIGGAKYDQVTDDIARRFCGFTLPAYATASATLRLPVARPARMATTLPEIKRQLRELAYHPERFVSANGSAASAAAILAKEHAIRAERTATNGFARHRSIVTANDALQPFVEARRIELIGKRDQIEQQQAVESILNSREYSFCLFPRNHFQQLIADA
jgi:hypothetical protein